MSLGAGAVGVQSEPDQRICRGAASQGFALWGVVVDEVGTYSKIRHFYVMVSEAGRLPDLDDWIWRGFARYWSLECPEPNVVTVLMKAGTGHLGETRSHHSVVVLARELEPSAPPRSR